MTVNHVFAAPAADKTGTVTIWDGATTATVAASDIVKPAQWNSGHAHLYTLTGNTSGNSTASGTNVHLAGSGGIVLGGSTATVVVSRMIHSFWDPYGAEGEAFNGQQGNGVIHLQPLVLPYNVQFDRFYQLINFSGATNSTGTYTLSYAYLFYTRSNETRLDLFTSWSATTAITHSGTASSASNNGVRLWTFGATGTLTEHDYVVGVWSRTTSGGANASISQLLITGHANPVSGRINQSATVTAQFRPFNGRYTSTTSGAPFPASINRVSISTNASVLSPPSWLAVSQYT